jgi:hypothetical protein
MGGANQPLAHAQFVSNLVDYGMNIQEAPENARFTVSPQRGCNLVIESRVTPEVRQNFPPWAINSTCGKNTPRPWVAGRQSCTTRRCFADAWFHL